MARRRSINYGISIEPNWRINYSVELARLAEKLSFSNVWVPDGGPAPPYSDSIVTLSAIAASTEKIKFGSAILNFFTRNPAWIASSFLVLSDLGAWKNKTLQRAVLGLGLGAQYNVSKFGIIKRTGMNDQLREAVETIRELLNGKEVTARTDSFAIEQVLLSKSKKKIPIHIGSQGAKGLRLAGKIADGVILTDRIADDIEESMKHVTLGLADGSRSRKDLEITNSVVISVDENRAKAKNAARATCAYLVAWMCEDKAKAHQIDTEAKSKIAAFINSGDESSAAKLVDEKMLELLTVSGNAQDCVEKCREHLAHGIDQIAFCEPFGLNPERSINLISRRVIPKI
ncbi:MAG: LLM class flavin-dependent oxidoreductase [Nitrososphaerota archaeon]|nr:LLM class flavin-dependent oxidoreductase [Nitrososphaerota archaeon]